MDGRVWGKAKGLIKTGKTMKAEALREHAALMARTRILVQGKGEKRVKATGESRYYARDIKTTRPTVSWDGDKKHDGEGNSSWER